MKSRANVFFLFIAFVVAGLYSCDKIEDNDMDIITDNSMDDTDENTDEESSEEMAPSFTLSDLNGQSISLSAYQNKVIVLFFFGNGCPPCKAIAPEVQNKLVDAYSSRGDYALLGIDQWDGNKASVQSFQSSTGVSFPLLLNGSATAKAYDTIYDRLVVIDKDGNIQFRGVRNVSSDLVSAKAIVDEYLNK